MTKDRHESTPQEDSAEALVRLRAEHKDLETRLEELDGNVYLTPDEQFERKRIQKLKLKKKDQIASLMTRD
jgi:uncharacterized protein YdcH (DUF465 family)